MDTALTLTPSGHLFALSLSFARLPSHSLQILPSLSTALPLFVCEETFLIRKLLLFPLLNAKRKQQTTKIRKT